MGQILDNYEEIKKNYEALKSKMDRCISMCDQKHYIESYKDMQIVGNIKNADHADHFILDNGLHVYRFVDANGMPIDYYVSAKPMIEIKEYQNQYGVHTQASYNGTSGIGYSKGGVGNSLPVDGISSYPTTDHIDLITCSNRKDFYPRMVIDALASPGSRVYSKAISSITLPSDFIGMFNPKDESYKDQVEKGDLESLIEGFIPRTEDERLFISEIQETLSLVNTLSLSRTEEKRSFLKKLLGKNKELDEQINAFAPAKGRR